MGDELIDKVFELMNKTNKANIGMFELQNKRLDALENGQVDILSALKLVYKTLWPKTAKEGE